MAQSKGQGGKTKLNPLLIVAGALVLVVVIVLVAYVIPENARSDSYQKAVTMIAADEMEAAAAAFEKLGTYKDSATYAAYATAVVDVQAGQNLAESEKALAGLNNFLDSLNWADYAAARGAEESGQYQTAIEGFKAQDGFGDSAERIASLENAQYDAAVKLVEESKLADAKAILGTLPEIKDSAKYLAYIDAMNTQDIPEAIEMFKALDGFLNSEAAIDVAQETLYQIAKEAFAQGDMEGALTLFAQTGERQDSADYGAYIAAERQAQADPIAALKAFRALAGKGFLDSEQIVRDIIATQYDAIDQLISAHQYEEALTALATAEDSEDKPKYAAYLDGALAEEAQDAIAAFVTISGFKDADERLEAARKAMYDQAIMLVILDKLDDAKPLFLTLSVYEDSAKYARYIEARNLEADEPEKAMEIYLELDIFLDSAQRAAPVPTVPASTVPAPDKSPEPTEAPTTEPA